MKKIALVSCVLTVGWLAATRASALSTVYDNGPVNGTVGAYLIDQPFAFVSDSFTLSAPANVTEAQIGLWITTGFTPDNVDWAIGSSAFGSDIGSGTSALSNTYLFTNTFGYDVYQSRFSLIESLGPGTYWLTLDNAVGTGNYEVAWDINSGPSSATDGEVTVDSESFQLLSGVGAGVAGAVPEPGGALLAALAGAALVMYGTQRRRCCAVAC